MFSKFTEKASSYASTAAAAANATYETGKQGLSSVPCDRCGVPQNALLRLSTCPVCGGRVCKGAPAATLQPAAHSATRQELRRACDAEGPATRGPSCSTAV